MTNDDQRAPGADSGDEPTPLPAEIEALLRDLTGGAPLPPEWRSLLAESGIGELDPAVLRGLTEQFRSLVTGGVGGVGGGMAGVGEGLAGADGGLDAGAASELARTVISSTDDPVVSQQARREVADAVRVADLWLDPVTAFTAPGLQGVAWSRAEWVEATMTRWAELVEPVARGVSQAVQAAMTKQLGALGEHGLPPGLVPPGVNPAALLGQVETMMRRLHGSLFSWQIGQGVGTLSGEVLSGCEPALPLVAAPTLALLPRNVAEFAEGLDLPAGEVLVYLAAREVARARLFHAVPWLGPQLLAAVRDYASGIVIDTEAIEASLSAIDPSNPDAVREALQGRMFAPPQRSAAQHDALLRLEASLALVEGWVDIVSDAAVRATLPHAAALGEAIRRRRATGGPAEQTFGALVGLELRPRRLRDAVNLFAALEAHGGAELRERAWAHPDLAPRAEDLDDVLGYVERLRAPVSDDMDAALDALLRQADDAPRGSTGDNAPGGPSGDERPDNPRPQ